MKPGIHTMAAELYHADPCEQPSLSSSVARILLASSPKHAWAAHPRLNPDYRRKEAEHFDVGTAAHRIILEGDNGASVEIVDAKDWRTNAAKEARDAARNAGKLPFLAKDWDAVQAMVSETLAQLAAIDARPPVFTDGTPEQTIIWEENGVYCRARLDWLRDDLAAIDDYKTTSGSANPEQWSRRIFNDGYDVQAAFYLRGLRAVTGKDAEFRFVVQETAPPYLLVVIGLAPAALELADAKVEHAINQWRDCLTSGEWPGYPTQVCYAELPGWEEARWLEREAREAA